MTLKTQQGKIFPTFLPKVKINKLSAYYVSPVGNPIFSCQSCRHFIPSDTPEQGRCAFVDEKESPDPGSILPTGGCILVHRTIITQKTHGILWGVKSGQKGILPGNIRNNFVRTIQKNRATGKKGVRASDLFKKAA